MTDVLDPPEVEGVAHAQVVRIAAPEAHSHAADGAIHQSPEPPQEVRVGPAGVATQALDLREHLLGWCGDGVLPTLDDHPLARGHR